MWSRQDVVINGSRSIDFQHQIQSMKAGGRQRSRLSGVGKIQKCITVFMMELSLQLNARQYATRQGLMRLVED